jgi:hypothetical protein
VNREKVKEADLMGTPVTALLLLLAAALCQGTAGEVEPALSWLRDTEWTWNAWSNIQLEADGVFVAENCVDREACRWWTQEGKVVIQWGHGGLHTVAPLLQRPVAGNVLAGKRDSDGDKCRATFVRKSFRLFGYRLPPTLEGIVPYFFRGEVDLQLSLLSPWSG